MKLTLIWLANGVDSWNTPLKTLESGPGASRMKVSARKYCGYRKGMGVRIFDRQRWDFCGEECAVLRTLHPGGKVTQGFTKGNLWRGPQEVGGCNTSYRVANRPKEEEHP